MSTPHRATPEQWGDIERWGQRLLAPDSDSSCLLELRARVEALEATQHAHADLSRLSDAEREQMAQELAKPAAWRPLEVETTYGNEPAADAAQILRAPMVVEGTFEYGGETYRYKANAEREAAMTELRAASAEARPGGLVESVGRAIDAAPYDEDLHQWDEARAAIRALAAWLRTGRLLNAAELLEQEANR